MGRADAFFFAPGADFGVLPRQLVRRYPSCFGCGSFLRFGVVPARRRARANENAF